MGDEKTLRAVTGLAVALGKAAALGARMYEAEVLGSPPVRYTGRTLCAMYDLDYTERRGRALLAAMDAGREQPELDREALAALAKAGAL